jgi:hypothetical protein
MKLTRWHDTHFFFSSALPDALPLQSSIHQKQQALTPSREPSRKQSLRQAVLKSIDPTYPRLPLNWFVDAAFEEAHRPLNLTSSLRWNDYRNAS